MRPHTRRKSFLRAKNRPRICIVTPDLLGAVRNGGIGTACSCLAFELAVSGHDVHVLFTQSPTEAREGDAWLKEYRRRGIAVSIAETWARREYGELPHVFPDHRPLLMAHIVYEWLTRQPRFDVVIFMEWQGNGFYALHAKHVFQDTTFVVQTHSPSLWHCINNADIGKYPSQALTWFMERQSLALADAVVSPSRYMLEWCASNGYNMPDDARVLPNLLNLDISCQTAKLSELVFFGRLEYRKGIVQFCDAVDLLIRRGAPFERVTFMGKFAWVSGEHAAMYIARRSSGWPVPVSILHDRDHRQALCYMAAGGRLAVMPSVADNSPYTVYECLKAGIPFVARNVGGIPELLPKSAWSDCLCSGNPRSLADKMEAALATGGCRPGLAFDEQQNRLAWREWLASLRRKKELPSLDTPKVSVCLAHYERPKFLRQAVASLLKQDYPNFEVILADDGSASSAARRCLDELQPVFAARGWKILRLENGFPGRARNMAARDASGDWLLFFDDDNVAQPRMISRLVAGALHSAADMAVCMFDVFSEIKPPYSGKERFLPLGGIVSYSALSNVIGDTASLVSRRLFERLGGFTEDYGLGHEDFELYLKAALSGAKIAIVPEVLFWYRRLPGGGVQLRTNKAANAARSLRPFLSHASPDMAELAIIMNGEVFGNNEERAAPLSLTEHERGTFIQNDPNSPESLVAVIRELFALHRDALAHELLATLARKKALSSSELRTLLEAKIFELLESHDHAALASSIDEFDALACTDAARAKFYLAVLERGAPDELRKNLYAKLSALKDLDIPLCIKIASMMFEYGLEDTGVRVFTQAMRQAEVIYLRQRPDVAKAIKDKEFASALHHYTLHGKKDNMRWPYFEEFSRICKKWHEILQNYQSADSHIHTLFKNLSNMM